MSFSSHVPANLVLVPAVPMQRFSEIGEDDVGCHRLPVRIRVSDWSILLVLRLGAPQNKSTHVTF